MSPAKPAKTFADYMVIAISPALVMVLVHSVCFFLVEVFYRGDASGGVRWVLFWFILAVVLIARIGIEQGEGHAMAYGVILALAVWTYLTHIQSNPVFGALLLGIVWFTAHKITSNCTLIDEDADASGRGLLQSIRQLPFRLNPAPPPAGGEVLAKESPTEPLNPGRQAPPNRRGGGGRPPAPPGIWLLYYSLAALPVFGLGQMLLPAGDAAARHESFVCLFCYLAAAMGLLVTTSFLGLRRYLRQRYLAMPGDIAVGWIKLGAAAAVAVLLLSLFLPRPGAGAAWGALRYHVNYQIQRASQYAARFNPHGSGPGRPGNQSPSGNQTETQASQSGQASNPNPNQSPGQNGESQQSSGSTPNQGAPTGQSGGSQPGQTMPAAPVPGGALNSWLRILFWAAAILGLLWLIYRCRVAILAFLKSAWAAIREFLAALRALFRPPAGLSTEPKPLPVLRRFNTFKNPFLTGGDKIWPPERLVAYTYDALQSWATEPAADKGSPKTPREFCRQLAGEIPEAADTFEHLAFLYGHVAYGASLPAHYDPNQLRQLWEVMSYPHQPKR